MQEVSRTTYNKFDNSIGWFEMSKDTDRANVYEDLAKRLYSKKVQHCHWIKRIVSVPLCNGMHKTSVYYDNGIKDVFIH